MAEKAEKKIAGIIRLPVVGHIVLAQISLLARYGWKDCL
jgi:hypothetical protein